MHKSENRTSLGRAKLGAQIPARRDSAQFDAGPSIKVECIFVNLADNHDIVIILCHLQTLRLSFVVRKVREPTSTALLHLISAA